MLPGANEARSAGLNPVRFVNFALEHTQGMPAVSPLHLVGLGLFVDYGL
jgi:hypothetical protein